MSIEETILSNLVFNEQYVRKSLVFIKPEYFLDRPQRIVFDLIEGYFLKYNSLPSLEALFIDLSSKSELNEDHFTECKHIISRMELDEGTKLEWLVDQTERWCQDKAIYNAIMLSIKVLDNKVKDLAKGSIPKILDALAVSFNTNVGHDFLLDWEHRYDLYHTKEKRLPFDLDYMNRITRGGLVPKTLNVILAGTGVGKTMFLTHTSAGYLRAGHNVLYITGEMAEERIAERIDANMLDVSVADLAYLDKEVYRKKIEKLAGSTDGRLIIKEYPTATAHAGHFKTLLNELKLKKSFIPDVILIDYLNIFCSSRIKMGMGVNSYTYVKAIAEELRGLAVEFNVPILTATQTNRDGFASSDVGLENTSESFGLPATADLMFALIGTEELDALGQIMVKQLKNRYNDPTVNRKFVIGVDKSKMRFYDVDQQAQEDLSDGPVMDHGRTMDDMPSANLFRGFK